jgi:hypothetical protein
VPDNADCRFRGPRNRGQRRPRAGARPQRTLVLGVHSGYIDTRQAAGVQGAKHGPADVAALVLDAVEAGHEELLADERTRNMKASLPRDLELIYPEIERQWQVGLR